MKRAREKENESYEPSEGSSSEKENSELMQQRQYGKSIFADPTLDISFKMLFVTNKDKEILISLINSLLNFKDNDLIIDVVINPNELAVSKISKKKGETGIKNTVDLLCTNIGKQQIAIEMQGQKTKYFLNREQEYMAKLIAGQVKEGEGQEYHEKILDTYIIIIAKNNMFVGNTAIKNQKIFEIDVKPMIVQTNEIYPRNKMHWKFFELAKFKKSIEYTKIKEYDKLNENSDKKLLTEKFEWLKSNLKEQWLEFLIECNNCTEVPQRNELIKKGYEIMKLATWEPSDQALYWRQRQAEFDFIKQKEYDKEEAFEKGIEQGKAEGIEQGKLRGEIKGEISKVKDFFDFGIPQEKIINKLNYLNKEEITHKPASDILNYIKTHLSEPESDIYAELGFAGDSMQVDDSYE